MGKEKQSPDELKQARDPDKILRNSKSKKKSKNPSVETVNREVLIKVGGFEYKTPTKKTRVFLGSLVIGLNLILVLAIAFYFYSPSFQQFIYNVGRN